MRRVNVFLSFTFSKCKPILNVDFIWDNEDFVLSLEKTQNFVFRLFKKLVREMY